MRAGLIWNVVGWLALSLAGIGVVLPIMPTVPFLLVAAWAFAKSSPELRQRIRNHPRYGKAVRDWQDRGAVPRLAKIWAIGAMAFGVGLSAWIGVPGYALAIQATVCVAVAVFLITRPDR